MKSCYMNSRVLLEMLLKFGDEVEVPLADPRQATFPRLQLYI